MPPTRIPEALRYPEFCVFWRPDTWFSGLFTPQLLHVYGHLPAAWRQCCLHMGPTRVLATSQCWSGHFGAFPATGFINSHLRGGIGCHHEASTACVWVACAAFASFLSCFAIPQLLLTHFHPYRFMPAGSRVIIIAPIASHRHHRHPRSTFLHNRDACLERDGIPSWTWLSLSQA